MVVGVRAAVVAAVASTLLAASCGKRSPTRPGSETASPGSASGGEVTEDEVTAERPATEVEDLTLARAIDRRICRKSGCCVSAIEPAGSDRKGRSLVVATIDTGDPGVASCLVPHPAEPDAFGSGVLDKEPSPLRGRIASPPVEEAGAKDDEGGGDADEDQASGEGDSEGGARDDCHPYEYHLVVHTKGKIHRRQLLTEACNNGYGAAGVGEDNVSVDADTKTFTRRQSGGSNWRWEETTTLGLDPFRVVSNGKSTFWVLDEDGTSESWDLNYDTLQGTETWSVADCEGRRKQAEAAKNRDGGGSDESSASKDYSAVVIPRVELPAAFVQDGWRSIGLGDCGALIDGDKNGFAVYGGKGATADAAMRVAISKQQNMLFVEISDDHWTREGRSWVKEDHIELWLAPSGLRSSPDPCEGAPTEPTSDSSRQWGIRISDGQVFPGFGSPEPLAGVEVVRGGRTARARIPVGDWLKQEAELNSITVVYSDSDDGLRQKRLIATSTVARGEELSLGHARDIDPSDATCLVKGKALRINRLPHPTKPKEAKAAT